MRPILYLLLLVLMPSMGYSQKQILSDLISDTIVIHLPIDSNGIDLTAPETVMDERKMAGSVLGVRQARKWWYIPVDQYFVLKAPLSQVLSSYLGWDLSKSNTGLVVDFLSVWKDDKPLLSGGWTLSGYTRLIDDEGRTLKGWPWEFRSKRQRKKKIQKVVSQLVVDWIEAQKNALTSNRIPRFASQRRYRRQLSFWLDTVVLRDGYILDGRLSVDFPSDQMASFVRGVPGVYYRKSSLHESIAIGGKDQQWYYRLNPSWLARLNATGRLGFNSFNKSKFGYVHWQNILLVNVGLTASVEYHPIYHKGLFAGIGLHQSAHILPKIIKQFETGILLTIGVVLP